SAEQPGRIEGETGRKRSAGLGPRKGGGAGPAKPQLIRRAHSAVGQGRRRSNRQTLCNRDRNGAHSRRAAGVRDLCPEKVRSCVGGSARQRSFQKDCQSGRESPGTECPRVWRTSVLSC